MSKIKNITIISKNIAKIAINGTVMASSLLPFAVATNFAINHPLLAGENQTMDRDELEYPAFIKETIYDSGEITSELTYVHPYDALDVDKNGVLQVTSAWEKKDSSYERAKSEYVFNASDLILIKNFLEDKDNYNLIKNQLKLVDTSIQKTDKINDPNELSYKILLERVDYNDTIIQKESFSDNSFPMIMSIFQIIMFNIILAGTLLNDTTLDLFIFNRGESIGDAIEEIKSLKLKK